MTKTVINSPRLGDTSDVARIVKAGDWLFIMGHIAVDDTRKHIIGKGDMKAQTRRCFDRIKIALEDAGAELDDIVMITYYMTDITKIGDALEAQKEYLPNGGVAGSGVGINRLAEPEAMIEIEAIAFSP